VVAMMVDYCAYCLGTMDDEWGVGLCTGCLMDRLRENPHEGVPVAIPDEKHHRAFLCPRCNGTGHVYASSRTPDTYCFGCGGSGWILRDDEGIQRTARWWATYQRNRQPKRSS